MITDMVTALVPDTPLVPDSVVSVDLVDLVDMEMDGSAPELELESELESEL